MVAIQNNLSSSSALSYTSFKAADNVGNKTRLTSLSMTNEISQFTFQINSNTRQSLSDQNAVFHFNQLSQEDKASLSYNGTPISDLSVNQAKDLISEDGYFGVTQTSQRITNFVLTAAGDDLDRLKAGREGILKGFEAAEKAWGGKLPEISYETLSKTLETVDERIRELGGSVVDLTT